MFDLSLLDPKSFNLLTILIIAIFTWSVLQLLTKRFINNITVGTPRGRRLATLSSVVRTFISVFIVAFVVFESLNVLGIDLAPLIAAAGVSGLAIGFGAQSLVKDVISGFFLLAEDQFDVGDDVEISGKRGIVTKISLRTIWLKEKDGTIHVVPSGSIVVVSNFTKANHGKKEKLDKKENDK